MKGKLLIINITKLMNFLIYRINTHLAVSYESRNIHSKTPEYFPQNLIQ